MEDLKCMQGVLPECEGLQITMDVDGFKLLTNEVVSIANFLLMAAAQGISGEMSFY